MYWPKSTLLLQIGCLESAFEGKVSLHYYYYRTRKTKKIKILHSHFAKTALDSKQQTSAQSSHFLQHANYQTQTAFKSYIFYITLNIRHSVLPLGQILNTLILNTDILFKFLSQISEKLTRLLFVWEIVVKSYHEFFSWVIKL